MNLRPKESPYFFEKTLCSECGEFEAELLKHKFSDVLTCVDCVNRQIQKIQDENESEGYYTEKSYNQLCEERNL